MTIPRRLVRRFLGTLFVVMMLCAPQASLLAQNATPPAVTPLATPAPGGVYRIHPDSSWQAITNVGAWVENNPTKLVSSDQDPEGDISRAVDLSDPHMVPTGLKAAPDGGVAVGYLTAAPSRWQLEGDEDHR